MSTKSKNVLNNVDNVEDSGDGTVVRALASQQCGPGLIPGLCFIICGLSFVIGSCPC